MAFSLLGTVTECTFGVKLIYTEITVIMPEIIIYNNKNLPNFYVIIWLNILVFVKVVYSSGFTVLWSDVFES